MKKILDLEIFPKRSPNQRLWLVGWLVGNAVFSETALRIFLIFYMKLGDYKGRKVTELDFWKKILIWRYSQKGLQISPKSETLIFFSKTAQTIFLVFEVSTKHDLQLEWNLFFRKICNLEIFDLEIFKINAQIDVFGHFLDFASLVFPDFTHNDRRTWFLVVFLQFASPVSLFLFHHLLLLDHKFLFSLLLVFLPKL